MGRVQDQYLYVSPNNLIIVGYPQFKGQSKLNTKKVERDPHFFTSGWLGSGAINKVYVSLRYTLSSY